MSQLRRWLPDAALLLVLACIATAGGWLPGRVLAPTDTLLRDAPWQATSEATHRPANFLLTDQVAQFVPWRIHAVERLGRGEIPLWNPYNQLGAPFLGNGQSAVFFPTNFLHLFLPPTWSWELSAVLRLWIAGLGAWFLAGSYGFRRPGALLAGLAFMLCGYNVVWLNHPHANVSILLPWVILAIEGLAREITATRFAALSALIGVSLLGGHPGTCIHLLFAAGIYAVVCAVRLGRRGVGMLCVSGLAAATGFALAGVQWFPMIDYILGSGVKQAREQFSTVQAFPEVSLVAGIVHPYLAGYGPDTVCTSDFHVATGLPNGSEIAAGFVGVTSLFLAIVGIACRFAEPVVRRWTLLSGAFVIIGIGVPGVDHVIRAVPGIGLVNNDRILFCAALGLAILAGRGLEVVLGSAPPSRRMTKIAARTAMALAATAVVGSASLSLGRESIVEFGLRRAEQEARELDPEARGRVEDIQAELVLAVARLAIPAAALGALALILSRRRRGASGCGPAIIGLAAVELLVFAVPYNPGAGVETYFPETPGIAFLRDREEAVPSRFSSVGSGFFPETATAYGLHDTRSYDAVYGGRYYNWIKAVDPPEGRRARPRRLYDPQHPAWRLLNLRYLMVPRGEELPGPPWVLVEEGSTPSYFLYENPDALPRAWIAPRAERGTFEEILDRVVAFDFDPHKVVLLEEAEGAVAAGSTSAEVRYTRLSPERIRLEFEGASGGWVVLSESYDPDWVATLTAPGRAAQELKVEPAYGVLQAIGLPTGIDGPVVLHLEYRPAAFRAGAWTSLITASALVLLLLVVGLARFSRR